MVSFCGNCGAPLDQRVAFGKPRLVCRKCGQVHFEDPKVAVGVVAASKDRLVLVRRAHEPKLGLWSFPSGFVDVGEVLEEAAAREMLEETGLEVCIERLLGAYSRPGERVIFLAYAGSVVGGSLAPGEECLGAETFAPDALPPLAFEHDNAIISAWKETTIPAWDGASKGS